MTFDPKKPVQTRDGRPARIICTDARDVSYPIVALVNYSGREAIITYAADGKYLPGAGEDDRDLINVPTKRTGWVNVYRGTNKPVLLSDVYATREDADRLATLDRIACVPIEWEECP